ncbi:MAG TPA: ATPase, T2SS/T4P/T4SS family, partial [Ilumatobacteraceae bacterium]|nr:ATPase, T2SS/T4P/T4SS family [Ilumatobacteraceae bacterium]
MTNGLTSSTVLATPRTPEHIDELLGQCLEMGGSDLHLAAGAPPTARVNGDLVQMDNYAVLRSDVIEGLVFSILSERKIADFKSELELDTSYSIPGKSRFRMNVFRQRGSIGAVLRTIPFHIPDFASLNMPAIIETFAQLPRGLVLVTGPTGSGKSTTLAA